MSEVFIARPGVLNETDKDGLRVAGILVVEANHEDVKFIRAQTVVSADEMLSAALSALTSQPGIDATTATRQREKFVQLLAASVKRSAEGSVKP